MMAIRATNPFSLHPSPAAPMPSMATDISMLVVPVESVGAETRASEVEPSCPWSRYRCRALRDRPELRPRQGEQAWEAKGIGSA